MDERDFAILGHLFQSPLDGPQAIARAVGITRNAVARRMRILASGPVGLTFFALPHHSLLGRTSTVRLFAPEAPPPGAAILSEPDVIGYDLNHDGLCAVTTWQDRPAAVPGLETLMGGPALAQFTDATPGPAAAHLTRLDWKVAWALLADPRASDAALARATGLAPRTCARARQRLVDTKAVRVGINLREDGSTGIPVFRAYVEGRPAADDVQRVLGPDAVVSDQVAEGTVYFARAASQGSLMAAIERLRRLPGVRDVKPILSRGNGVAVARLQSWCQQHIAGPAR